MLLNQETVDLFLSLFVRIFQSLYVSMALVSMVVVSMVLVSM